MDDNETKLHKYREENTQLQDVRETTMDQSGITIKIRKMFLLTRIVFVSKVFRAAVSIVEDTD